ncbi:hypothetical protein KIW84_014955 [Lathyrus oleraceus]|uniref:Uncharacterized protein n=1 Tax=Pisum sativum TaxID=3888 RepID=A0A9D5BPG3_PEA|nr:hypothetical protein KIW84_014955 [Pisum sativum]
MKLKNLTPFLYFSSLDLPNEQMRFLSIFLGGAMAGKQTISKPVTHPSELPKLNYNESSTGQAYELPMLLVFYFFLSPQAIFKDLFRGGNNILVRGVILKSCFI